MALSTKLAVIAGLSLILSAPVQATLLKGYVSQEKQLVQPASLVAAPIGKTSFEGSWQCLTEVVDSNLELVPVGQRINSEVRFLSYPNGDLSAQWSQPGWIETQNSISRQSQSQLIANRTSYYFSDRMNGTWTAQSQDCFQQLTNAAISSESYVNQYLNGQYIGHYRTRSTLHRLSESRNIAINE